MREHTDRWSACRSGDESNDRYVVRDQDGTLVILDTFPRRRACLIAAAPLLLAAARQAMEDCCDLIATDAGNALEEAIAAATGEQA